jgi:membrane fusion protein (multidrug efflux system)
MAIWKQILLIGLLAALALGGFETYQRYMAPDSTADAPEAGPRPVTVETARAEPRLMQETIEAVGTTRARRSIEIVPEVDGRLVELRIRTGSQVSKGDILARLDNTIERANLAEAEALLIEQQQIVDRIRQLRQSNAASQANEQEAASRLAVATAARNRALRRLQERDIIAPFDGVVGLTNLDVGAHVIEGEVITRLDDLSEIEVEFAVPETVYARVSTGLVLTARSAAFPEREFTGTIEAVDSRIDPVSRAFRVRALVPNPDSTLPAGMFLSLTLVLAEETHLTVPEEAIVFQAAETYVFVPEDGIARRRVVTTGQRKDGVIAILSGLAPGEEVIVRGLQRVRDGSPVNLLDRDAGATAETGPRAPETPT